jgi:glycosyltransferase involved in cell wall biosynthesis
MTIPAVSVIIPVYNGGDVLNRAIQSLKQQTFKDFEVIIVDDGSDDNTYSLAVELTTGFPLKSIIRTRNQGVAMARNTGLKVARGEFIAFLDADDQWMEKKLEKQVGILNTNPSTGLVCTAQIQEPSGKWAGKYSSDHSGSFLKSLVNKGNFITTSSVILRSSILREYNLSFYPGLTLGEDWLFWITLSQYTRFYYMSEPLVRYQVSPVEKYNFDLHLTLYRKLKALRKENPGIRNKTCSLPVQGGILLFSGLSRFSGNTFISVLLIFWGVLISPRKIRILQKVLSQG